MRWTIGWAAAVALAGACSSPLQRPLGGIDAGVDHGGPIGATVVDAAPEIGRGPQVIDAGPDHAGRVAPAPLGTLCQSESDCASGFCVDDVCCQGACTGPCMTCSMPGAAGTCRPLAPGAVARVGGCPTASPATCGMTGMCDGVGGCELYPAGTLCARSACVDGATLRGASTCDGLGGCRPGPTESCAPYTCASGMCQIDDCRFDPASCPTRGDRDASPD